MTEDKDHDLKVLGEFGLIERFRSHAPDTPAVEIGIGDDAAVVHVGDARVLFCSDATVEGTHFLLDRSEPEDVGWKALAVNVSDIAAMGGIPVAALVTLVLPLDRTDVPWLDRMWSGMQEAADAFGVALVGGDTTSGGTLTIDVSMIGEPGDEGVVIRGGARIGDVVCVTGSLGSSAAGLAVLLRGAPESVRAEAEKALTSHRRPDPRLEIGSQALAAGVSAMIDISDGLVADLGHICEESGVAIEIDPDTVPVASEAEAIGDALGFSALSAALSGGEDYELAMTMSPDAVASLTSAVEGLGISLTVIGTVTSGAGVCVPGFNGKGGWDHFAEGGRT